MTDFPNLARAALVTGAGKRIGRAMALELGRLGFAVAVHYGTSRDDAEAVAGEIRQAGGKAAALGADLTKEADVTALMMRAQKEFGAVGVLINNASAFDRDEALTATRESWDAHMEVNLRAPFVLMQELARQLPPTAEGAIINMVDERVWNLTPHFTSYTVSKVGLWALTQSLALAFAPRIRVNAIGPGPVLPSPRQSAAQFARQVMTVPLQRGPTLDEIAGTLRFILTARSMTGQMIALDGGQHLNWGSPALSPKTDE